MTRYFQFSTKTQFQSSDFFPRHQMQKKLMLRPSAVPTENLPPEITDLPYSDRPDSPENTSSSFLSLDQSDSSTAGNIVTNTPVAVHTMVNNNNVMLVNNNNNIIHTEFQDSEVKLSEPTHFTYHPATPIQAAVATPQALNFQPATYESLTTLSTVPYQEINQDYTLYDGTEIDREFASSISFKSSLIALRL